MRKLIVVPQCPSKACQTQNRSIELDRRGEISCGDAALKWYCVKHAEIHHHIQSWQNKELSSIRDKSY